MTVTASIGVALAAADSTAQTLLRDADAAMYRAKDAGRDRVVHFHTDMHQQDAARLDTEAELRRALDRGELRAHYQPVVDVAHRDDHRRRGPGPLAAPAARTAPPGRVHPPGRGDRADRPARAVDARPRPDARPSGGASSSPRPRTCGSR